MLPSLVLNLPELPRFILTADADQPANGCCTGITKASGVSQKGGESRLEWSGGDPSPAWLPEGAVPSGHFAEGII